MTIIEENAHLKEDNAKLLKTIKTMAEMTVDAQGQIKSLERKLNAIQNGTERVGDDSEIAELRADKERVDWICTITGASWIYNYLRDRGWPNREDIDEGRKQKPHVKYTNDYKQ